jgi:translation initiation factor 3 subunit C
VVVIEGEPEILAPGAQPTGPVQVRGLLLSQLERLDEEYFKSLQFMDPHTQDYVVRMRHEPALLKLLKLGFDYFEARGETQKAANLAARRLDHLYYRRETEAASQRAALREAQRQLASEMQDAQMARDQQKNDDALRDSSDSAATSSTAATATGEQDGQITDANPLNEIPDDELTPPQGIPEETNLIDLVPQLCALVYKSNEERLRIRAVLQHIYHLALHDKYFEARDRMLATRMQDEISNASDITMHIAFNRALVQLGLAAFRKGRIADAHHALAEIMGPRVKELLAQGVVTSKFVDRTLEQEKLERRRQMPYPMHINIDLVEFVHLTSAMLLEVPNMAANVHDQRKRIISKTFRKTLENTERQTFTGPPENTRDHVIAAAKSLIQSDWNQCSQYLLNLDIWKLIPKADDVKAMLKRKIQEEALRTHLFTNAQFYETIKLDELVSMFGLPQNSVHAIVSKMMIHDELLASWDQPSAAIIMNGQTPTHLQHLSLQYAERISALFDNTDSDSNRGFNRGGNWDGDRNQSRRQGGQGGQQGGQEGQGGFRSGGQGQQSGDRSQGAPRKDGDHHGGRKYDGKRQDGQKSRIGAKSSGNSGGKKRSHHN